MGFGVFEGVWRTMTGTVVGSRDVDLEGGGEISFRLKRKDDLLYAVMVFKLVGGTHYYPMDSGDLRELERALLATREQLEASRLDALARAKRAEMKQLGVVERIWRWAADPPLWKEEIYFGIGGRLSFHIRRSVDRHCEIVFMSGDEARHLSLRSQDLANLEDALIETRTAIESSRSQARAPVV